jgi:hypothetical protein
MFFHSLYLLIFVKGETLYETQDFTAEWSFTMGIEGAGK